MGDKFTIKLLNGAPSKDVSNFGDESVEEAVMHILESLSIIPLCSSLFGIRDETSMLWPHVSKKINHLESSHVYSLRLRFRMSSQKLNKIDPHAYEYYYYQVRWDLLNGELADQVNAKQGLGLVVTDIVHHLLLNPDKKLKDIDIKCFMPKVLNSMPFRVNVKKTTENLLESYSDSYKRGGPSYVREQYLEKYEDLGNAVDYEKYDCEIINGTDTMKVDLIVDPFDDDNPAIMYVIKKKKKKKSHLYLGDKKNINNDGETEAIKHICRIEQLVFVGLRKNDCSVEISHEAGVPIYIRFMDTKILESFIGCVNGHYHLMKIWSYDLCKELPTPSLIFLKNNRCHGPVGATFAAEKLNKKGGGESGVGLLRMSGHNWHCYHLMIYDKAEAVQKDIVKKGSMYHFKGCDDQESSIISLVRRKMKEESGALNLKRILPPSDLDFPKLLLLCAVEQPMEKKPEPGPSILFLHNYEVKDKTPLKGKFADVYFSICLATKEQVAVKVPHLLASEKPSFIESFGAFLAVKSDAIVKVFGLSLNPLSIVMECFEFGPLDAYLISHKDKMRQKFVDKLHPQDRMHSDGRYIGHSDVAVNKKFLLQALCIKYTSAHEEVDLVESCTYLAKALWDLQRASFTHANIRCHNVFVVEHNDLTFRVKLTDPGKIEYSIKDIHWIPREHIDHPSSALTDPHVDTWAFATTLWQIFSLGLRPLAECDLLEVRALYAEGHMLPCPRLCPKEVYQVMQDCWHADKYSRKRPQVIVRDINHIFYYFYNCRRDNEYSKIVLPEHKAETPPDEDAVSLATDVTNLTTGSASLVKVQTDESQLLSSPLTEFSLSDVDSTYFPSFDNTTMITMKDLLKPVCMNNEFSMCNQQLELDNSSIKIMQRIGNGHYGYVYRGVMSHPDGTEEEVALKRLISVGNSDDFRKETNIMKSLRHENIVLLYGLIENSDEGDTHRYMVMEYLPLGSLQDYVRLNKEDPTLTSDKKLLAFVLDIAKGMDYLESKNIIHRDLAARNVLVSSEDHVKITDFGLAQQPNQGNYYIMRTVRELPVRWFALESIEHRKYSHKSDVWSYGVTCWETFTRGLTPDLPNDAVLLIQALRNGKRLTCRAPCHHLIYSKLILGCWDEDAHRRPDFTKLISIILELQEEFD